MSHNSTWTEEIQERQFVKEKETSGLGWNDVQVWNQPCTDKSSSLGLEKDLFYCTHVSSVCREALLSPMRWREKAAKIDGVF